MALSSTALTATESYALDPARKQTILNLRKRAKAAAKDGRNEEGAKLYLQLFYFDSTRPIALFNAAVLERRAGQLDASARHLRQFLAKTPKEHPYYKIARNKLDAVVRQANEEDASKFAQMSRKRAEKAEAEAAKLRKERDQLLVAGKKPTSPTETAKQPDVEEESTDRRVYGIAALGIGGVMAAVAGGLYLADRSEHDSLREDVGDGTKNATDANARIAELNDNVWIYGAVATVGLGLAALGGVLGGDQPRATPRFGLAMARRSVCDRPLGVLDVRIARPRPRQRRASAATHLGGR